MNSIPNLTDVFVIGGGPAGLAAAIAARQRGFDVTVADCSIPPVDKACGEGIMPDGLEAARTLGLDFRTGEGFRFRGIRFRDGGTQVEAAFPRGRGLGLRRTALHQTMVERAAEAGVRLAWGAHVTGIESDGAVADGRKIRARWIIGADGGQSRVRRWAGLDACRRIGRRFGFRRHYAIEPWSEFMEIHWANECQFYITPVGAREICVVLISRDRQLRPAEALGRFPELARRLQNLPLETVERGAVSATRRLRSVCGGNVALIGDAAGSVDAITGEGLCLLFRQSVALAGALAGGDVSRYETEHQRIMRRPQVMADLMLLMDGRAQLRRRAMHAMHSKPRLFSRMLAMHVGELSIPEFFANGLAFGWEFLIA